jgi:hypothetical protein
VCTCKGIGEAPLQTVELLAGSRLSSGGGLYVFRGSIRVSCWSLTQPWANNKLTRLLKGYQKSSTTVVHLEWKGSTLGVGSASIHIYIFEVITMKFQPAHTSCKPFVQTWQAAARKMQERGLQRAGRYAKRECSSPSSDDREGSLGLKANPLGDEVFFSIFVRLNRRCGGAPREIHCIRARLQAEDGWLKSMRRRHVSTPCCHRGTASGPP